MGTSTTAGYVLTADVNGYGTWQAAATTVGGNGASNYLARWVNATQLSTGVSYDNGSFLGIGYTAAVSGALLVNGNVGIGTTNPGFKLDVNGTLNVSGLSTLVGTTATQLHDTGALTVLGISNLSRATATQFHDTGALTVLGVSNLAGTTSSQFYASGAITGGSSLNIVGNSNLAGATVSQFYNSGTSSLTGNVGIGTSAPVATYKLYVAGAIYGTTITQNGYTVCDASGNCPSSLTGTGATNYLARWISATQLSTGVSYDNGTFLGVGYTAAVPELS